jgi:hypothetical protein
MGFATFQELFLAQPHACPPFGGRTRADLLVAGTLPEGGASAPFRSAAVRLRNACHSRHALTLRSIPLVSRSEASPPCVDRIDSQRSPPPLPSRRSVDFPRRLLGSSEEGLWLRSGLPSAGLRALHHSRVRCAASTFPSERCPILPWASSSSRSCFPLLVSPVGAEAPAGFHHRLALPGKPVRAARPGVFPPSEEG